MSRLKRIEQKKSRRQALLFGTLTLFLLAGVVLFGIPSLIKLAVFLGDLRSSGQSIEVQDTVAPPAPKLETLPEATNSAKLSVRGFAEPGSTVELAKNDQKIDEIVADKEGRFIFGQIELGRGENRITAEAVDSSGNRSQKSSSADVYFDDSPPPLQITNPQDGAQFFDEDKEIIVAGTTESDTKVTVNSFFVLVDTDGNFVKKFQLSDGENQITVTASDQAGNQISQSVTVSYSP